MGGYFLFVLIIFIGNVGINFWLDQEFIYRIDIPLFKKPVVLALILSDLLLLLIIFMKNVLNIS